MANTRFKLGKNMPGGLKQLEYAAVFEFVRKYHEYVEMLKDSTYWRYNTAEERAYKEALKNRVRLIDECIRKHAGGNEYLEEVLSQNIKHDIPWSKMDGTLRDKVKKSAFQKSKLQFYPLVYKKIMLAPNMYRLDGEDMKVRWLFDGWDVAPDDIEEAQDFPRVKEKIRKRKNTAQEKFGRSEDGEKDSIDRFSDNLVK